MSIGSIDLHLLLPKRKHSKLSQIQEEGGEEEMAQAGTPEAEAEVMEDKGMLQQKAQEEQMEQVAHKILQEEVEVRKTTTQI